MVTGLPRSGGYVGWSSSHSGAHRARNQRTAETLLIIIGNRIATRLHQALQEFNGKEIAPLAAFLAQRPYDVQLGDQLLEVATLADEQMQRGATWLLKRAHEEETAFSAEQASQMLDLLGSVTHVGAGPHL